MLSKLRKANVVFLSFLILLSMVPFQSIATGPITYDIVIEGGTIYNPSTEHELIDYNIGIMGSKIERITKYSLKGKSVIDASGLIVSPGFVDLISYDPNYVGIELKVLDGVTSNLAMHGGTEDATSWYRAWGNNGVITNFGASTFVTRLRWPIVGYGVDNEMTKQEDIDRLVKDVRENIEAGALGISFSFEYVPGIKNEIKPLLELASEYDVPTFYHLRYSDEEKGLDGIQEVIDYGNETGAAIHVMHINSTGGTFVMDQALKMVEDAKENGLDITSCFYPYDFWATYIDSARFRPGWQDRFKITYEDLQIGATDIRITEETFDHYRSQHLLVAAHGSMPEEELIMLLQNPDTMIGSDTIIEPGHNNHPRGAGAYSRVFGKFVREENILSMMDAIKKVSYFPAKRMESAAPSMKYKGRIEIGSDADITIFNPDTIIDKSTVAAPGTPSVGVEYVLVNGVVVKDRDGLVDVPRPGKPIMSYFVDKTPDNEAIDFKLKLENTDEISIEKTYEINNKIYLPLNDVFNNLNIPIENFTDGKINVGNILDFEIGSKTANLRGEEIQLDNEPIMYKEDIYISLSNLKLVLYDDYKIEQTENVLSLEKLKTDKYKDDFHDNKEDNTNKKDSHGNLNKEASGNNSFLIYGLPALLLIVIIILFKKKK